MVKIIDEWRIPPGNPSAASYRDGDDIEKMRASGKLLERWSQLYKDSLEQWGPADTYGHLGWFVRMLERNSPAVQEARADTIRSKLSGVKGPRIVHGEKDVGEDWWGR